MNDNDLQKDSSSYTLDDVYVYSYIYPSREYPVHNGTLLGSVTETIDYGSSVTRSLTSSAWSTVTIITPANTGVYFSKERIVGKSFSYLAEETGVFTFGYDDCLVHDREYTLSLQISGPK